MTEPRTDVSRPFVRIVFQSVVDPVTVERYWYHVPRLMDFVSVGSVDARPAVAGTVARVRWLDDGSVEVLVR